MTRRRTMLIGLVVAAMALALVGCGGSDDEASGDTSTTETTETSETTEGTGTKIVGTVGEEGNADAFTITLMTEDGSDVTTLTPGDYTLEINDLSTIHNFHLTGPGGVDVSSEVSEVEDEDYNITLEAGTYDFVCDPHSSTMNGSFEVSS
jgi:plastocyanin